MRTYSRLMWLVIFSLALGLGLWIAAAPSASADSPAVHVVSWGDTLFSIATRYGTSVNAIMQINSIRNADMIYIGQRLIISGSSAPAPINSPSSYVVQNGDTLFSIATRNGTTVNALMQANGLYNYWIYAGQTLRIPGQFMPAPIPLAPPVSVAQPMPGQGLYHMVRNGDYLNLIATRYRTTPYAIQIANKLPASSFIYNGQRLYIPGAQQPVTPDTYYSPLPSVPIAPSQPIQVIFNPPQVVPPQIPQPVPAVPTVIGPTPAPNPIPGGNPTLWEAVLITNTVGRGPCSLLTIVVGKDNWPVVVATPDGTWISDPKTTGTKPERGPYAVEFAHACTGVWRVIPLGLNIYADVQLNGGHAEIEFHPRN